MSRPSQPRRRKDTGGTWFARIGGKKVWLAPAGATRAEALDAMYRALAEGKRGEKGPAALTFRDAANLFTAAVEARVGRGELAQVTLDGYDRFLVPAARAFGAVAVAELRPHHAQAWLDGYPGWCGTTRANAVTAVKACLNWARRMGYVAESPLRDLARPRAAVTETDMTPALAAAVMAGASDQPFRDLLAVLWGTGARPSEVVRIEAAHLDTEAGVAVLPGKTTRATGRNRVIYLAGESAAVLARLAGERPAGPLLLNSRGRPWTRPALAMRFRRIRAATGAGKAATAKGFRHGFATDALEAGTPIATVAELMGHGSTRMVERHYSKLRERTGHLKEAAGKVRG